jgi:hypothetical protein
LNEQVDTLLKAKSSAEFSMAEEKDEMVKTIAELQCALNAQKQ